MNFPQKEIPQFLKDYISTIEKNQEGQLYGHMTTGRSVPRVISSPQNTTDFSTTPFLEHKCLYKTGFRAHFLEFVSGQLQGLYEEISNRYSDGEKPTLAQVQGQAYLTRFHLLIPPPHPTPRAPYFIHHGASVCGCGVAIILGSLGKEIEKKSGGEMYGN